MSGTPKSERWIDLPGVELAYSDVAVGMRVWVDCQHPVFRKGFITYTDHRVVSVMRHQDGTLYAIGVEPWNDRFPQGLTTMIETRCLVELRQLPDVATTRRKRAI
jgi:hypothetical protein